MTMRDNPVVTYLREKLNERRENQLLRSLKTSVIGIDFTSNDYLGIARHRELHAHYLKLYEQATVNNGSTGSRLLSGNSPEAESFERWYAGIHNAEAGLLFNSGYDANVGLLSCIAQRHDTLISDELVHASIIDGMRLSYANRYKFAHNQIDDLEAKLRQSKGLTYVVVESVYSMDGDIADLRSIAAICKKYKASLIVDEAHALGIRGTSGKGLVDELGLREDVFARIHTFGKAAGFHGACILGSRDLIEYLINFSRPFIYSTALPPLEILMLRTCLEYMFAADEARYTLSNSISVYNELMNCTTPTPIKALRIPGNSNAIRLAHTLQKNGFDVRPILSPTVPEGTERLRVILHSFNSVDEIKSLCRSIQYEC